MARKLVETVLADVESIAVWWVLGEIAAFGLIALAALPGQRLAGLLGAGLNLTFGLLMTVYVFGLDTYTNNGSSRWANRGSTDHRVYYATMGAAAAFTALFLLLAARGSRRWTMRSASLLAGAALLILGYGLVIAFDNN